MRILDIGCGGGAFLRVARDVGAEVEGVEPSLHGSETCRAANIPVFHGILTDYLATCPGQFDLVTCNHVLEHEPEPGRLLSEMATLVQPGGVLYIAVPNAGSFFAKALGADWHSADLPVHVQHFSLQSLRRLLEDTSIFRADIVTRSENSLPGTVGGYLRKRILVPQRLTNPFLRPLLASDAPLGRLLDQRGLGDAIIVRASPAG